MAQKRHRAWTSILRHPPGRTSLLVPLLAWDSSLPLTPVPPASFLCISSYLCPSYLCPYRIRVSHCIPCYAHLCLPSPHVTNPPSLFVSSIRCSDHSCDSLGEPTSACLRSPQPQSGDRQLQRPREHRRGPPLVSEGLDLEVLGSTSEARKARSGQRHRREKQDRKPGSWEPAVELEDDELERSSRGRRREPVSQERLRGPPAFILDGELECAGGGSRERRPRGQERTCAQDRADDGSHLYYDRKHVKRQERRLPSLETSPNPVMEERHPNRRRSSSHSPDVARRRLPLEGRPASKAEARHRDLEEPSRQGPRRDVERERERAGYGTRAILHRGENWEMESGGQRSPGEYGVPTCLVWGQVCSFWVCWERHRSLC